MISTIRHKYNRIRIKLVTNYGMRPKPYRYSHHENLLGRMETLRLILKSEASVSRFGDGELIMALFGKGIGFQKRNPELSLRLEQILKEKDNRVLVCINNEFMRTTNMHWLLEYERSNKKYDQYINHKRNNDIGVLFREKEYHFYNKCYQILFGRKQPTLFGDATLFMLGLYYSEYIENKIETVKGLFRNIINNKRLLIVCPKKPLLEPSFQSLENKLKQAGAKNIKYIIIPNTDAFSHYSSIKKSILKEFDFDITWIQSGPTATVLAHDLSTKNNILSYDIGSLNTSLKYLL